MKISKSKHFVAVLCVGFASLIASSLIAQGQQNQEKQQIEKVVRQFWGAMGKGDSKGLKSTLWWPSILQEVKPTSTSVSHVLPSAAYFDDTIKSSADDKSTQQGFGRVVVSDIKISVLDQSVASVIYKCNFPELKITNPREHFRTLDMLTVLQKQPLQKSWKITYTTIPQ